MPLPVFILAAEFASAENHYLSLSVSSPFSVHLCVCSSVSCSSYACAPFLPQEIRMLPGDSLLADILLLTDLIT